MSARVNEKTQKTVGDATNRLAKSLLGTGMLALLPLRRLGAVGSSFHCGSTFPMKDCPVNLESDTLGRPAGLKRVHVVDASVFPSIPATTITLSVMANAHRIATESSVE
jgi:choline dehydrogenase-like flavoprotein